MLRYFSKRFINFRIKSKKLSFIFLVFIIFFIFMYILPENSINFEINSSPHLDVMCLAHKIRMDNTFYESQSITNGTINCLPNQKIDKRVLLILSTSSKNNHLKILLESLKISHDTFVMKNLDKINLNKSNYSLVIVENLILFYNFESSIISYISNYCQKNGVYLLSGSSSIDSQSSTQFGILPLYLISGVQLNNYYTTNSNFLYFAKKSVLVPEVYEGKKWSFLMPVKRGFDIIAFSEDRNNHYFKKYIDDKSISKYKPIVVIDLGLYDGIKKIIFSTDLSYWMNIVIFMDALKFTCNLDLTFERYIQIDIDDIFVGKSGSRMIKSDVDDLLSHQQKWSSDFVEDFRFNLGFSGFYFKSGNNQESEADEFLISKKHFFNWFPHMWSHKKPHLMNKDKLSEEIMNNVNFAKKYQLNTSLNYAIAPFHSGVYPIYDLLYDLWQRFWNVSVTSTEEYPKLNPSRDRKGFIYKNLSVLPRQTCGIYTHTIYLDKYPKGKITLNKSILGGSLFLTILYNKINIFMTHFSNYGSDRLGLYTFDSLFRFIHCFTNLKLIQKPPNELASIYFNRFPNEKQPVWYNPCSYKRHKFILPITYSCSRLPKFIIVGPQKTASTALYKFLNLHPELSSNNLLSDTFEETQFFTSNKYVNGVEWYMNLFTDDRNRNSTIFFEKSATYFDSVIAPELMHNLLPDIKIVILLRNPIYRAYSWYQHVLAHKDKTALRYTFHQVVTAENSNDINLIKLRNRCLVPGLYYDHLQQWIKFYLPNNIILLDSDQLTENPITLMNGLQELLPVNNKINYSDYLKFSEKKGFFCSVSKRSRKLDCLGPGKGRRYKSLENNTRDYLSDYYLKNNQNLIEMLKYYRYNSFPRWLNEINL